MTTTIHVDFIPKHPADINVADKWLRAECDDMHSAERVEALFHGVGWVARVAVVETVTRYPAPTTKESTP